MTSVNVQQKDLYGQSPIEQDLYQWLMNAACENFIHLFGNGSKYPYTDPGR